MKVGYSKKLALVLIVLGVIVIGLRLVLMGMGARGGAINVLHMIPGIICVFIGLAYQTKPQFIIADGVVEFRAPFGPAKKRYPYSAGELSVRDNALYVGAKKTGGRRWMANKADWDRMVQHIEGSKAFD